MNTWEITRVEGDIVKKKNPDKSPKRAKDINIVLRVVLEHSILNHLSQLHVLCLDEMKSVHERRREGER